LGNVVIEDDVELGSNVSVDRATMGSTIIRKGVKLDNLIQVAHNVEVGENTVIAAQTGIAGSTKIGARCMIGGQVAVNGHISVADETKVAPQSGIANNVREKGGIYLGSPIQKIADARRMYAVMNNLPQMYRDLYQLKKEIEELKKDRP
jgi:UDP-3-O-[3-hydroxymyristoyl] glucosamine N-acyltransferase